MKHSNTWFALILIALALFLSAANAEQPSPRPTVTSSTNRSQRSYGSGEQTQANSVAPAATTKALDAKPAKPAEHKYGTADIERKDSGSEPPEDPQSLTTRDWLQVFFNFWLTVATIALAIFTWKLVGVTRDVHRATEKGTEVANENVKAARASAEAAKAQLEFTKSANEQNIKIAAQSAEAAKQSAQIARLALDVERPYIFIESREVSTRNIKGGGSGEGSFAALLLTTNEVENQADADYKQISLSFGLRNRGRGVAIVQAVKLRLIEMPTFRRVGNIPIREGKFGVVSRQTLITTQSVVGSGEISIYETVGMAVSIDDWKRLQANGLPAVVVRVSYVDTTERRFRAVQRFTWITDSGFLFIRAKLPRGRPRR